MIPRVSCIDWLSTCVVNHALFIAKVNSPRCCMFGSVSGEWHTRRVRRGGKKQDITNRLYFGGGGGGVLVDGEGPKDSTYDGEGYGFGRGGSYHSHPSPGPGLIILEIKPKKWGRLLILGILDRTLVSFFFLQLHFQPWTFQPRGSKIHGWKVWGWKVKGWIVIFL